jgi:hypothetical protein
MENKRTYSTPEIQSIQIDNEISLVLTTPPGGPGETKSLDSTDDDEDDYDNY